MGMEDCGRERSGGGTSRVLESVILGCALIISAALPARAQDVPNSKDPAGMKRYEGSDLIGYRAPQFDEYVLPLGPPTSMAPPVYAKSAPVEGLVSYYTYMAPAGHSPVELFRNYRQEFLRLGIETLYEKDAGQRGWFGPTFNDVAAATGVSQILAYDEAEERLLVGKTKDTRPAYYLVFVTAYKDGVIPDRLRGKIDKGRALAQLVVVTPEQMEKRMTFVNADEMGKALHDSGKVALYGVYFDTGKDVVKAESQPTLEEIAKLMRSDPALRLRVVGHTDTQGKSDYNVDLSRRRAASVVRTLTSRFGIAASRLDAFGCGPYCPAAANGTEDGRARNRRVELVEW
jgi:OOP family OmpA-OmpF porin